jgi:phosphate:Na+ symporter
MGLGLIFFGLELMKEGFSVVKELPEFELWFQRFSADSYLGVLKCAAVGCILTFIVQSSSATLGITISLAQLGVIEFDTAAALVLGENIGTTITAWLASFGATTNAKRSAYFHIVFNVIGVGWITAIFQFYIMFIRWFVLGDSGSPLTVEATSPAQVTAGIAATHTFFNVANTILFLPLSGYFAQILTYMIRDRVKAKEEPRLTSLDVRMLEAPAFAIEQSREEIILMANNCKLMMDKMRPIEEAGTWTDAQAKEIFDMEKHQDAMQVEFVDFMSNLLSTDVTHKVIDEARAQIRLVDEYESISDCIASVLKRKRYIEKRDLMLDEPERADLMKLHQLVYEFMDVVNQAVIEDDRKLLADSSRTGEEITKFAKSLYRKLDTRPPDQQLKPFVSTSYSRHIAGYRQVRDHLVNIAEVVKGEK